MPPTVVRLLADLKVRRRTPLRELLDLKFIAKSSSASYLISFPKNYSGLASCIVPLSHFDGPLSALPRLATNGIDTVDLLGQGNFLRR